MAAMKGYAVKFPAGKFDNNVEFDVVVIGGGDTVALISEMNMEKKFTFVSTGGGATLDFLANGTWRAQ